MTDTVKIGSSSIERSHVEALRAAWRRERLVLVLGAGVSAEYGVPGWEDLVTNMVVDPWRKWKDSDRRKYTALLSWVVRDYGIDPLMAARALEIVIEKEQPEMTTAEVRRQFREIVRLHLYGHVKRPPKDRRTTLRAVADLIKAGRNNKGGVQAVVTLNFDDFLEQ